MGGKTSNAGKNVEKTRMDATTKADEDKRQM